MDKNDDDDEAGSPSEVPKASDVGYGRPPEKTRFVKGQSGNPAGRPLGSKNKPAGLDPYDLNSIIKAEANRRITVTEKGEEVTMSMIEAVMRKIGIDALKGRPQAQATFTKLAGNVQREEAQLHERYLQALCENNAAWQEVLGQYHRGEISRLPKPLPHPDDVFINLKTGEVEIRGPMNAEEAEAYEYLRLTLRGLHDLKSAHEAEYRRLRSPTKRAQFEAQAVILGEKIAGIEAALPASYIARKEKEEAASQE